MKRAGVLVAYLVFATVTIMDGAHYMCRDCGAKLANQVALTWHNEQSTSCRAVRAMKAAKELVRLGESGPSIVYNDDNDFDAPEGPFYDEREAMEERIDEDALNSDSDDSDWEDESGEVVGDATAKRKFDSQLETAPVVQHGGPKEHEPSETVLGDMAPTDEGRQVQVAEGARCSGLCERYGKVPSKGGGWQGEGGFNHASLQIHAWFQSCGHF
jgi:hypothetical protein